MFPASNAIILPDEVLIHLNQQLIQAGEEKNYDRVESLILQGAYVDAEDHLNKTLLHIAVEKGDCQLFQVLMRHNADVNAQNHRGDTSLHYAAKNGNYELARSLLQHKANVNLQNRYDETPLHNAAQEGHSRVVQYLVNHNADVNPQNHRGDTSLHYAAQGGHGQVVEILLKNPNTKVNAYGLDGQAPLHYAAQGGHGKVVKILIDHKAIVEARDHCDNTPLCYASRSDKIEAVEILISHNADVNAKDLWDKTILHNAAAHLSSGVAKTLIDHNANVNTRCMITDSTVLHHLVENLPKEQLSLSNIGSQGVKSLRDFTDFLKILSETDINPNIPNRKEQTSLEVLYKKYDSSLKPLLSQYTHGPMVEVLKNLKENIIALTVKAYICEESMALHTMCREDIEQYIKIIPELHNALSAAYITTSGATIWTPDLAQLLEDIPASDMPDNSKATESLEVVGGDI